MQAFLANDLMYAINILDDSSEGTQIYHRQHLVNNDSDIIIIGYMINQYQELGYRKDFCQQLKMSKSIRFSSLMTVSSKFGICHKWNFSEIYKFLCDLTNIFII